MDRKNIGQIGKALNSLAKRIGWLLKNYLVPVIEESAYFISRVLTVVIESLQTKDHSLKAEFGSTDTLLSASHHGFCVDGQRRLSGAHSQRNMMLCASTGMGKSTIVSIPTILTTDGSLIINDPSGEQLTATGAHLKKQNVDIKIIDPSNPARSSGFNILEYCHSHSDAQKIAHLLARSVFGSSSADPFWQIQATNVITMMIRLAQYQTPEYRNLANARHLVQCLTANPKLVDKLMALTGDVPLIQDYKAYLGMDIKLQTSIQATALASLQIFADPAVAVVTSHNTIDLTQLRKRRTAIFIQCKTTEMKYYSTLISIMIELITKHIMSELPAKNKPPLPVYFILDEASSLYLPSLSIIVANCRKYAAGVLILLQNYEQLCDIYGRQDAESIRSNCFARMYMGAASHPTSIELSQMLGKYEWQEEEGKKKGIRDLLTPQEIRQLPGDKAVLICANYMPLLLTLRPYYKNPFLRLKTQSVMPEPARVLADGQVRLITG